MGSGARILSVPPYFTVILNHLGGTSVWKGGKYYLSIKEQVTFKSQPDEYLGSRITENIA